MPKPIGATSVPASTLVIDSRLLARTSGHDSGTTRGTTALRATPKAREVASNPSAIGIERQAVELARQGPHEKGADQHRGAERHPPSVQPVEDRPDDRCEDRERRHRGQQVEGHPRPRLAQGHREELRAGEADRGEGVAGRRQERQLENRRQAGDVRTVLACGAAQAGESPAEWAQKSRNLHLLSVSFSGPDAADRPAVC